MNEFKQAAAEKKRQIIILMCLYVLLVVSIQPHLNMPIHERLIMFISFSVLLLLHHALDWREVKKLEQMKIKFAKEIDHHTRTLEVMKNMAKGIEPKVLGDSVFVTLQSLRQYAMEFNQDGACKSFEVDQEFDAVLVLKRKSLPIDEILNLLHKRKQL